MNFPAWEKFHTLLENSRNAKTNSVACLCITLSFGWNLQFSPVRYFARGYPIRLPEVTFGISRARAISLEHKNTMFKYIKTLKCGQTKNIYFTKHDIYFTKLMLILQNINLELKSALRTKYWFYQTLLYNVQCTGHVFLVFMCQCSREQFYSIFWLFHSVQNFVLSEHSVISARSPQAPKQVTARIPIV